MNNSLTAADGIIQLILVLRRLISGVMKSRSLNWYHTDQRALWRNNRVDSAGSFRVTKKCITSSDGPVDGPADGPRTC